MGVTCWPRSISWSEFEEQSKRPPGETRDALTYSDADAPTSGIRILQDGNKWKLGPFTIKMSVLKSKSWIVTSAKSADLLSHEQGHYDIAGLCGWQEYRDFEGLRASRSSDLGDRIGAILRKWEQRTQDLQDYYDSKKQSDHGKNATGQAKWDTLIADAIKNNYRALPTPPPRDKW